MEEIDWLEQAEAFAVRVKGEETVLPLYGLETEGLEARAGTAEHTGRTRERESNLRSFIRTLFDRCGRCRGPGGLFCFRGTRTTP